jgi:HAD superfamily hydrolase (TIGR01549 family)
VIAWHEALQTERILLPNARIHRCVGMSGKLMLRTLFAEMGRKVSPAKIEQLEELHKEKFKKRLASIRVLSGARELLQYLSHLGVRWAIATSGDQETVKKMIQPLRVPRTVPVITGDLVERAKPDPDVFLEAAARLHVPLSECVVVGDSVWDLLAARRAKSLGIGLLCGGYGESELLEAGAYRVYKNPEDLLEHLMEIGIQGQ